MPLDVTIAALDTACKNLLGQAYFDNLFAGGYSLNLHRTHYHNLAMVAAFIRNKPKEDDVVLREAWWLLQKHGFYPESMWKE